MLRKFSVENFKGFRDKITLDIGSPSNYSFNSEIIENGCVTKGIIYGINSCGKSNLGLAIFDIITHSGSYTGTVYGEWRKYLRTGYVGSIPAVS